MAFQIFKEEVFDLLESNSAAYSKADGNGKPAGPSRAPIQIRETANGGISLAGVTEAEVTSQEEMASFLLRGSVCRATGSTNMNSQSRFVLILYSKVCYFHVILLHVSFMY